MEQDNNNISYEIFKDIPSQPEKRPNKTAGGTLRQVSLRNTLTKI